MGAITLSLDQVESSDVYVPQMSAFSFKHPMQYLEPFFKQLEPLGATFTFEGEIGSLSKEREREDKEEQDKHIAYSRLVAKARLPEAFDVIPGIGSDFNHLWSEIGLVYAFDTKSPEIKVYRGKRVSTCTNQCIFGADNVTSINLARSNESGAYTSLKSYVDTAMEDLGSYVDIIQRLASVQREGSSLKEQLGHMLMEAKRHTRLGTTCVNDTVNYILDPKTRYALVDGVTNDWMLYNACTESLKKSNILDEPTKTLLLEKIFHLN